ncbi:MAG: GTPase Era [Bacteroidales bacterium]|nr:GTPase Era [Bacteroidales bacterium]
MKSGFVNIIGNPNVGKSTLLNALVGEKLSIITPKAQTTRHRMNAVVTREGYQIIFTDTPGIVDSHSRLHQNMMASINVALQDADVYLLVVETGETLKQPEIIDKVKVSGKPIVFVINKIDLSDQDKVRQQIEYWREQIPQATIIPTSATNRFGIEAILDAIQQNLPDHAPYYPDDTLTDRNMRFFVSEIIRKHILMRYQKEIPYACEVEVERFKEERDKDLISVIIYTERESQKAILLGHHGAAIKQLGIVSRRDIEIFTGKHCFLEMHVKVLKDWRNDENALRRFGYED